MCNSSTAARALRSASSRSISFTGFDARLASGYTLPTVLCPVTRPNEFNEGVHHTARRTPGDSHKHDTVPRFHASAGHKRAANQTRHGRAAACREADPEASANELCNALRVERPVPYTRCRTAAARPLE